MSRLLWLALLFICLALMAGPMARAVPVAMRLDLVLLLALFAASRAEPARALGICWLAGVGRDMLSAGPMGEYTLLYLGIGFGMLKLRDDLDVRRPVVQAATAFLGYALVEGIYAATHAMGTGSLAPWARAAELLSGALVTACAAPMAAWAFSRLEKPLGLRRRWTPAG